MPVLFSVATTVSRAPVQADTGNRRWPPVVDVERGLFLLVAYNSVIGTEQTPAPSMCLRTFPPLDRYPNTPLGILYN